MRQCPQCGKNENEISMTTDAIKADDNKVSCPCGWNGTYADLKDDGKKSKSAARKKLEKEAKALELTFDDSMTDEAIIALIDASNAAIKAADVAAKVSAELTAEAVALGIGIKEGTTDDEIRALIEKAKTEKANQ